MTEPTYRVRAASVQGVKHVQNGINNQDAQQVHEFAVPKWERTFRIGFVSDGCSGIPAFSRSEVGANLTVTYCVARVQQLILGGAELKEIPLLLYHSLTSYLHAVASLTMPANVHWVYPVNFSGSRAFRNDMSSTDRFLFDYLMATVIGYIDDGTTLVTFRIGDGVMIGGASGINGHITIGDGVQIAAMSGVVADIPAGEKYGGVPARPMRDFLRDMAEIAMRSSTRVQKKGGNDE